MSPKQGTLGKRRLHAHCGEHEGERRGARSSDSESPKGSRSWTSDAAMERRHCRQAKLGADVLGVDIARNLVEAGKQACKRSRPHQLQVSGRRCVNLHELKDQTFDLVVSIFGAMFAPKPFDVAKEMVRVTRPGGRIVMGNWIPMIRRWSLKS